MWRQHQNLNRQLPHLARIPHVLSPFSEMRVGDICAWSQPADPHQLQSAFWSGGPGVQVSTQRVSDHVYEKQMCVWSQKIRSFNLILSLGAPVWSSQMGVNGDTVKPRLKFYLTTKGELNADIKTITLSGKLFNIPIWPQTCIYEALHYERLHPPLYLYLFLFGIYTDMRAPVSTIALVCVCVTLIPPFPLCILRMKLRHLVSAVLPKLSMQSCSGTT